MPKPWPAALLGGRGCGEGEGGELLGTLEAQLAAWCPPLGHRSPRGQLLGASAPWVSVGKEAGTGLELGDRPHKLLALHVQQSLDAIVTPAWEENFFAGSFGALPSGPQPSADWADDFSEGLTQEAVVGAFLVDVHRAELAEARLEAHAAEASLAGRLRDLSSASSALADAVDACAGALDKLRLAGPRPLRELGLLAERDALARAACEAAWLLLRPPRRGGHGPGSELWGPARELLLDGSFLELLFSYDKEHADPEAIQTLRSQFLPILERASATADRGSSPAALLREWLQCVEVHHRAARSTTAARRAVKASKARAASAAAALADKETALRRLLQELGSGSLELFQSKL